MLGPHRQPARGFTLVEIVLALGVFAFAIIGIVFLLGTALQSTTDTGRDSALSATLTTTASLLRSYDSLPSPLPVFYFDVQGSQVPGGTATPDLTKAYYQCKLASVDTTVVLPNQQMYKVTVTAPYPKGNTVGTYFVSYR